jgi:hypothetical protein
MQTNELTDEQRQSIAVQLRTLRDRGNTPEAMGWAIVDAVLSRAATMGTLNGDHLEVSGMITVSLPYEQEVVLTPAPATPGSTDEPIHGVSVSITCTRTCSSIFGVEVLCVDDCHTTTVTTESS